MIIVGLGNPGTQYEATRHNVGFAVVDALATALDAPAWSEKQKLHAAVTNVRVAGTKVVLAKPQTFMNDSGTAVRALLTTHRATPEDLWVVHDDVDLPLGTLREAFDRGSAGHHGIDSIMEVLGTKAFHRLRVGVSGDDRGNLPTDAYVLAPIAKDVAPTFRQSVEEARDQLLALLHQEA